MPASQQLRIAWMDHEGGTRTGWKRRVLFGTIDTWLVWKLTDRYSRNRLLRNAIMPCSVIRPKMGWWDFGNSQHSKAMLQKCAPTLNLWKAKLLPFLRWKFYLRYDGWPTESSPLFGQLAFELGMVKNTYGTGCSVMWIQVKRCSYLKKITC